MMKITIGTEEFNNIPESYDEMNLGKFMEIMILQNKEKDFKSKSLFTAHLLSVIIGCEVEYILEFDSDEIGILADAFSWLREQPEIKEMKTIVIDDITYVMKTNSVLTLGEQVSIETFLQKDLSNAENFHLVMSILLRPAIKVVDEFTKIESYKIKPLEDDFNVILERAEMFKKKLMIENIYGVLTAFSTGVKNSSMKTSVDSSRLKIVRGK